MRTKKQSAQRWSTNHQMQRRPNAPANALLLQEKKPTEIELPEDEFLMRAIVACGAEFANPAFGKMTVWKAITQVCGGRFLTATAAQCRASLLKAVWREKSHRLHAGLTYELKSLLSQYENVKERAMSVDPERYRALAAAKQPRLMQQCIAKLMLLPGAVFSEQATTAPATTAQATAYPVSLVGTTGRRKTIDPSVDEQLMQLVATKRRPGLDNTFSWAEIAQSVQLPLIRSGEDVRTRVEFLVSVFHNPTHGQHAKLTPTLRQSLVQYVSSATQGNESQDRHDTNAKLRSTNTSSELSDGGNGSCKTEMRDADDEDEDKEKPEATKIPTESDDGVLLREILRSRPFHAGSGKSMEVWDTVAASVCRQLRRTAVFPTGRSCLYRMKALLRVVRDPQLLSQNRLPRQQLKMLQLLATLIKTRWPRHEADRTEDHRKLLREIRKVLKTSPQVSEQAVCSSHSKGKNEGDKQGEQLADTGSKESNKHKRKQDEHCQPEAMSPPRKLAKAQTAGTKALGSDLDRMELRAAMEMLKQEREANRHDTSAMLAAFKDERDASKRETAMLLEMLKQEREANRRDGTTMLEMLQKESSKTT